jgi:hypothetical protein
MASKKSSKEELHETSCIFDDDREVREYGTTP